MISTLMPDGALFESFLGTGPDGSPCALWDVSELLPKHRAKKYRRRELESVRQIYVHHSGRLGAPGFSGAVGSARYAVRNRGWPGIGYHIWIPYLDHIDSDGRRVVYRCQQTETRTYHAGTGANDRAVAIALQGNLSRRDMSEHQSSALPVVIKWFASELGIPAAAIGHWQAPSDSHPKASCPGRAGKGWVLGYAAGRASRAHDSPWS